MLIDNSPCCTWTYMHCIRCVKMGHDKEIWHVWQEHPLKWGELHDVCLSAGDQDRCSLKQSWSHCTGWCSALTFCSHSSLRSSLWGELPTPHCGSNTSSWLTWWPPVLPSIIAPGSTVSSFTLHTQLHIFKRPKKPRPFNVKKTLLVAWKWGKPSLVHTGQKKKEAMIFPLAT